MTSRLVFEYVNDVLFIGLAGICVIHWRQQGGPTAAWLAATFGSLAGIVLVSVVLSASPAGEPSGWIQKLLVVVLLLFPYLLFRFTASLDRSSLGTEVTVGVLTGTVLLWTLLLPSIPAEGQLRPAWFRAYLVAVLLEWTTISLVVAAKLWRAGGGQPTVVRRRMHGLALGAVGLSLVIVLAAATPSTEQGPLAAATQLLTLVSVLLFYLAFAPPAALREVWRLPERETMQRAMGALMAAERVDDVVARVLPSTVGMVGGRGAALLDESGRPIGAYGQTPGLQAGTPPGGDHRGSSDADATAGSSGMVRVPLSVGALLVWTGPYAPVFGRQELQLLTSIGSLVELAVERARTAERDSQLAAVVDASGDAIVSTTLDGTIRSWSPAAKATYGPAWSAACWTRARAGVSDQTAGRQATPHPARYHRGGTRAGKLRSPRPLARTNPW